MTHNSIANREHGNRIAKTRSNCRSKPSDFTSRGRWEALLSPRRSHRQRIRGVRVVERYILFIVSKQMNCYILSQDLAR